MYYPKLKSIKIQCFPYPNEHAARIKSPGLFVKDSMRSKQLETGLRIIIGKLKTDPTGSMKTQAYRFNKANYTVEQARAWLKKNNIKTILFEKATDVQAFKKQNIILECFGMSMAADEIMKHIPLSVYNEIKEKNQHPYFQAYSIIHEGVSKPKDITDNSYKPIEWGKNIISKMGNVIKKGLQFFVGHNKDNSTDGRRSVGEVVADFQKKIGNTLHHIVVGYFPDRGEAEKYDVCSIEANIVAEDHENMSIAKKIQNITGIALGNSQKEKPAFSGAVRLGAVQAFGDNGDQDPPLDKYTRKEIPMTFEEIKQAVKSMNIFPNQLYTEDELKNDRVFGKIFDDAKSLSDKAKDYDAKIKEKDDKIKSLERDINETGAQKRLDDILKTFETEDKKLTDLQKNFISKRFDPKSFEELTDDNIKEFVDTSLTEYSDYASMFGKTDNGDNNQQHDNNNNGSGENKDDVDQVVEDIFK